jgi:hypothetical protein
MFRIGMLLKFYRHTLVRMLNESAQLIVIITKYDLPYSFHSLNQPREVLYETISPSNGRKGA